MKKKTAQIDYIEKWLKRYKMNEKQIQADREFLEEASGPKAVVYDQERVGKTYRFYSDTENKAMNMIRIRERYENLQKMKRRIDQALEVLSPLEQEIIVLKYIDNCTWYAVARQTNISERACYRMRDEALPKMQEFIFGEEESKEEVLINITNK